MSIRQDVSASFVAQFLQVTLRLLIVPFYIKLMGIEAYGLVGLYILFAALIQLLNFGLNSTMSREIARMRGKATNSATVRHQLRRLAIALFGWSLGFTLLMFLLAPIIASRWLLAVSLPISETIMCIRVMAFAAAISFVANLYKAGLLALNHQVKLNVLNSAFTLIGTFGALPVLIWISPTPAVFFCFLAFVNASELCTIFWSFYRKLPPAEGKLSSTKNTRNEFRRFAGGLALTDVVWAGVLQIDRLVLSTVLPLTQFGFFTVMTAAAFGVLLVSSPILQALQPRFAVLAAEGRINDLQELYRKITYGVTALVLSAASILIVFPEELIFAWVGNRDVAVWARSVLPFYAAGNAFVGVMSLPFLLQFALGDIRLHVIGHVAIAALYLPLAIWLGVNYGAIGTGAAWLAMNCSYFVIFVPLIHARLLPSFHSKWMTCSVLPAAAIPLLISLIAQLIPIPESRFAIFVVLSVIGLVALSAALLCSPEYRKESRKLLTTVHTKLIGLT